MGRRSEKQQQGPDTLWPVPFTLAHAAAALPFKRFHLVTSALVIGTFAPDFEYFLRLAPDRGFGHTVIGALVFTLPVALVVFWLFHSYLKRPFVGLLPEDLQGRLQFLSGDPSFRNTEFLLIIGSILIGITTNIVWDSFTHVNMWPYRHISLLREDVRLPIVGMIPVYKVLQHGSTVAGCAIVAIWIAIWHGRTTASSVANGLVPSTARRVGILLILGITATAGAFIRAWAAVTGAQIPNKHFVGLFVVTWIALAWWELLAYGLFSSGMSLRRL